MMITSQPYCRCWRHNSPKDSTRQGYLRAAFAFAHQVICEVSSPLVQRYHAALTRPGRGIGVVDLNSNCSDGRFEWSSDSDSVMHINLDRLGGVWCLCVFAHELMHGYLFEHLYETRGSIRGWLEIASEEVIADCMVYAVFRRLREIKPTNGTEVLFVCTQAGCNPQGTEAGWDSMQERARGNVLAAARGRIVSRDQLQRTRDVLREFGILETVDHLLPA